MSMSNKIKIDSQNALDNMKTEIANELGIVNYDKMDKGSLTARENGYVGGMMTKRLVEMAQQQLSGKSSR